MTDNIVKNLKVSIIGAGRSGAGVAQLMKIHGAKVFVSDNAPTNALTLQIPQLTSLGIDFETGKHSEKIYDADLIIISPGVPSSSPLVKEAKRRGIRIVSELEAASWFCPAPIIAVTGSNGKTTTTMLIGQIMQEAKKSHIIAGNIGRAFSSSVQGVQPNAIAVLEVSSFQLDHIESFHPKVSVILNITPDHLDRYNGLFDKYIDSKRRIFENQTSQDYLIYCYDNDETREQVKKFAKSHVHTVPFSINRQFDEGSFLENEMLITAIGGKRTEIIQTEKIFIRGVHNIYNSMAAALAAQLMGVGRDSINSALENFKGVEHRLEFICERNGVKYFNDSKATNVDSVWYALQAFTEPIVLLLGGRDKGNDYSKIFELVKRNVKMIIAMGESADKIIKEFRDKTKVTNANSMEQAVKFAKANASPGDIVLLSPACASFDWFKDYEHRGTIFKQLVNTL